MVRRSAIGFSAVGLLFIYCAIVCLAGIYLVIVYLAVICLAGIYLGIMGLRNIVWFCLAANFRFDVFWERVVVCEQEGCKFGPFLFRRIYLCFGLFLGLDSEHWGREQAFEEGIGDGGAAGAFLVAHLFSHDLQQDGGEISDADGRAEDINLALAELVHGVAQEVGDLRGGLQGLGGKAKRPCRLAIGDAARAAGGPSFVLKGGVVENTIRAARLGMGLALGPVVICVAAMPGWVGGHTYSSIMKNQGARLQAHLQDNGDMELPGISGVISE